MTINTHKLFSVGQIRLEPFIGFASYSIMIQFFRRRKALGTRLVSLPISLQFYLNRPFPSSPQPPFHSEAKREVFVMKISFHSYYNWN